MLCRLLFCIRGFELNLIIQKTLNCLEKNYNNSIKWPTELEFLDYLNKFKNYVFDEIESVICVVNGTELKINQSSDKQLQKIFFSMKKKQFSINFQIIVLLNGDIVFVSKHQKRNL